MTTTPPPLNDDQQQRFERGIAQFNAGGWFEAHETWESLWLDLPHGPRRRFVQGLIQLAVALEHTRRGNPRGALMLLARTARRFGSGEAPARDLGVDGAALHAAVTTLLEPLHDLPAAALRPRARADHALPVDLSRAPRIEHAASRDTH
ncbi:MAG: DUF309 domain-containing protein [Phycisphaeraceae bacterium]